MTGRRIAKAVRVIGAICTLIVCAQLLDRLFPETVWWPFVTGAAVASGVTRASYVSGVPR